MSAGMTAFGSAALDYLAVHGIDPELAATCGVREAGGQLAFPYRAPDGATFRRVRSLNGAGPAKVKQPPGRPLVPWWPLGRPETVEAVLVCEGESDALAVLEPLAESRFTTLEVVAVPGTGFPARRLAEELADLGTNEAYLALDGDDAGRSYAEKAARTLSEAGIRTIVVELEDGSDMAETLAQGDDRPGWIDQALADAEAAGEPAFASATERSDDAPELFARTDLGNAERLVAAHGAGLRHVRGIGWLAWDGRRFRRDEDGSVMRCAKATARGIYEEAAKSGDPDARKRLAAWAGRSEARPRLEAMVALAESEEPVLAAPDNLDADPYLLNVENGTLDLRTGELREPRRADLLTKLGSVTYDPSARDERLERFLATTTGGDNELAGFLRRAAGYTLSGSTGEEVLFFAHGAEATGKSTFLDALSAVLGDYAATADFDTFLTRRGDAGPRADIARLAGKRLVTSLEVDDGKCLAEGLVKQLTGGDQVAARHLYGATFEFRPAFKLWLAANARPQVSAPDGAIWRRIIQVPFNEQVAEADRDPTLKQHLKTAPGARAAILAWAVRGCLEWQAEGLKVPARVRDYTAAYREENDPVAEWLDACCRLDAAAITPAGELRRSYESWVERSGERPISAKRWGEALRSRGCERARQSGGSRHWTGIAVTEGDR